MKPRTPITYVTQEMWDASQEALREALQFVEERIPPLSTSGSVLSLAAKMRSALWPAPPAQPAQTPQTQGKCELCNGARFLPYFNGELNPRCHACNGTGTARAPEADTP